MFWNAQTKRLSDELFHPNYPAAFEDIEIQSWFNVRQAAVPRPSKVPTDLTHQMRELCKRGGSLFTSLVHPPQSQSQPIAEQEQPDPEKESKQEPSHPEPKRRKTRTKEEIEQEKQIKADNKRKREETQAANKAQRLASGQKRDRQKRPKNERELAAYGALATEQEKVAFNRKWKILRVIQEEHEDAATRAQAFRCLPTEPDADILIQAWKEREKPIPKSPKPVNSKSMRRRALQDESKGVFRDQERTVDQYMSELEAAAPLSSSETWTLRLRLRPTAQQRKFLRCLFEAHRYTYNRCVTWMQDTEVWRQRRMNQFTVDSVPLNDLCTYILHEPNTPAHVRAMCHNQRQTATREFQQTFRAVKKKPGAKMHWKQKNMPRETVSIISRGVSFNNSGCRIWPDTMLKFGITTPIQLRAENHKNQEIHSKQWARLQQGLERKQDEDQDQHNNDETVFLHPLFDCKIQYDRGSRRYDVLMPIERTRRPLCLSEERIIALDPGVRTFLTGYCPSGSVLEFGHGDEKRLIKLAHHSDKLQSQIATEQNAKRRKRLRAARLRLLTRLRNLRNELHWQTANLLCKKFDVILLPRLATKRMIANETRSTKKDTKKNKKKNDTDTKKEAKRKTDTSATKKDTNGRKKRNTDARKEAKRKNSTKQDKDEQKTEYTKKVTKKAWPKNATKPTQTIDHDEPPKKRMRTHTRIEDTTNENEIVKEMETTKNTDVMNEAPRTSQNKRKQRQARPKISKDTKRKMGLLSHFSFRSKLIAKAKQHGKLVLIVNEAFTSKTCTRCGWQNDQLKGSKLFYCRCCGLVGDRDTCAARNILIRASCVVETAPTNKLRTVEKGSALP